MQTAQAPAQTTIRFAPVMPYVPQGLLQFRCPTCGRGAQIRPEARAWCPCGNEMVPAHVLRAVRSGAATLPAHMWSRRRAMLGAAFRSGGPQRS